MIDGTATLNGLTFGCGTVYEWTQWPAGLGTAEVRASDQYRPRRAGVTAGDDPLGGRTVVFDIECYDADKTVVEQALTDLAVAFAPQSSDVWLDVRLSGTPAEYSLKGRPRGCEWNLTTDFSWGFGYARCTFVATDPIKYGPEETVSITLGSAGAGLTYPVEYPIVYGGSSLSGIGAAANSGKTAVEWSAVLSGPLQNPRLEHVESGRFIKVGASLTSAQSLTASQTLTLDSRAGALLLGGSTPRPQWFAAGSSWFRLAPGSNSLRLTADSGTGGAVVKYRPGWP